MSQYVPRRGPPQLEPASPSPAQGKTGGKEPSITAVAQQSATASNLDAQREFRRLDSQGAASARMAPSALAVATVEGGRVRTGARLEGLRLVAASGTALVWELSAQASGYRVVAAYQGAPVLAYVSATDGRRFTLSAFDVVGAAPVDLSSGTHELALAVYAL